jgi:hypothetical protein
MTLLDAPKFDEARERRNRFVTFGSVGLVLVLLVSWWLVAGRPVDWPWNWNNYLFGRATVNGFLTAVEKNDLPTAYGIWLHDKDWQKHPTQNGPYSFERFQEDWSPASPENEYGVIQSHKIVLAGRYGNGLLVAVLMNGRKSKPLNLQYDPKSHALSFSPPGVELYLGP